jgi:hypothetical protein
MDHRGSTTQVDPNSKVGGWGALIPLQLVHQWKYGEGEGEEEVEKRRKMKRERKKKRLAPLQSCSTSATDQRGCHPRDLPHFMEWRLHLQERHCISTMLTQSPATQPTRVLSRVLYDLMHKLKDNCNYIMHVLEVN